MIKIFSGKHASLAHNPCTDRFVLIEGGRRRTLPKVEAPTLAKALRIVKTVERRLARYGV